MASAKMFGVRQVLHFDFGDGPLGSVGDRTLKDNSTHFPKIHCDFSSVALLLKKSTDDRVESIRVLSSYFSQLSQLLGNFFGSCFPNALGHYSDEASLEYFKQIYQATHSFHLDALSSFDIVSERALLHWKKLTIRELVFIGVRLHSLSLFSYDWEYKSGQSSLYAFQDFLFSYWMDFFYKKISSGPKEEERDMWRFLLNGSPSSFQRFFSMIFSFLKKGNSKIGKKYEQFFHHSYSFLFIISIQSIRSSLLPFFQEWREEFSKEVSPEELKKNFYKVCSRIIHECDHWIREEDVKQSASSIILFLFFRDCSHSIKETIFSFFSIQNLAKLFFFQSGDARYFLNQEDFFIKNLIHSSFLKDNQAISSCCDSSFWIGVFDDIKGFSFFDYIKKSESFFVHKSIQCYKRFSENCLEKTLINHSFLERMSSFFYYHKISVDFSLSLPDDYKKSIPSFLLELSSHFANVEFSKKLSLSKIRLISFFFKELESDFLSLEIKNEADCRVRLLRNRDFQAKAISIVHQFLFDSVRFLKEEGIESLSNKGGKYFWDNFEKVFEREVGSSEESYLKKVFRLFSLGHLNNEKQSQFSRYISFDYLSLNVPFHNMKSVSSNIGNFFFVLITFRDDMDSYDLVPEFLSFWRFFCVFIEGVLDSVSCQSDLFYKEKIVDLNRIEMECQDFFSKEECHEDRVHSLISQVGHFFHEIKGFSSSTGNVVPSELSQKMNAFVRHSFSVKPYFFSKTSLSSIIDFFCFSKSKKLNFFELLFENELKSRQGHVLNEIKIILKGAVDALAKKDFSNFLVLSSSFFSSSKKSYAVFRQIERGTSEKETKFSQFLNDFIIREFSSYEKALLREASHQFYNDRILFLRSLMKKIYIDSSEDQRSEEPLQMIYFVFSFLWRSFYQGFYSCQVLNQAEEKPTKCTYNDVKDLEVKLFERCFNFDLTKHIEEFLSVYKDKTEKKKRDIC